MKVACEQAPKWGIGQKEKLVSRASGAGYGCSIFVFALYPTWEPVHRLGEGQNKRGQKPHGTSPLMPIDPRENFKKSPSHFVLISILNMFLDFSSSRIFHVTREEKGRGQERIAAGKSTPSKNNFRGITIGIGPIRGINPLTPLSSLVFGF